MATRAARHPGLVFATTLPVNFGGFPNHSVQQNTQGVLQHLEWALSMGSHGSIGPISSAPDTSRLSATGNTCATGTASLLPRSPIGFAAQNLGVQARADIQEFIAQDDDEFPALVSDYDSSSDSSDDESIGEAILDLKQVDTTPEHFRAMFLGPRGFKTLEAKNLINALKLNNTQYEPMLFDIQTDSSKAKGPVFKPLDEAKIILARHYLKKYKVVIEPATRWLDNAGKAKALCDALKKHGSTAFGMVFAGVTSITLLERPNFKGHVLPYLVQRDGNEIHLIELSSAGPDQGVLDGLYEQLPALLAQQEDFAGCEVKLHQLSRIVVPNKVGLIAGRQVDGDSCHTDAMQILKDALVLHQRQPPSTPLSQIFPERPPLHTTLADNPRRMVGLPAELLKTAQYSAFVTDMSNPTGLKAVQTHRNKYTSHAEGTSPINQFLLIKALRNSTRIFQKQLAGQNQDN